MRAEKRATKSDKIIVLFSETETAKQNQKISFPFLFPLRGGGVGGGGARKMQGNFLVFAHASPRACPRRIRSLHRAIRAYEAVSSHHALRACEVGSRKG